jgi:hypothetical protein
MSFEVNLEKFSLSELESLSECYGIIINSFNAILNVNEIYIRYNRSKEAMDFFIETADSLLNSIKKTEAHLEIIKERIKYIRETS